MTSHALRPRASDGPFIALAKSKRALLRTLAVLVMAGARTCGGAWSRPTRIPLVGLYTCCKQSLHEC
jgi:hypothetical protein